MTVAQILMLIAQLLEQFSPPAPSPAATASKETAGPFHPGPWNHPPGPWNRPPGPWSGPWGTWNIPTGGFGMMTPIQQAVAMGIPYMQAMQMAAAGTLQAYLMSMPGFNQFMTYG